MKKKLTALVLALAVVFNISAIMPKGEAFLPQVSALESQSAQQNDTGETTQPEDKEIETSRLNGDTRYTTALKVADRLKEENNGEKFSCVVVASGEKFADAMSSSYLAAKNNAPILLTNSGFTDKLVSYIKSNAQPNATVYIIGGNGAVDASTDSNLKGFKVRRLKGTDRYQTNIAVLKEAGVKDEELLFVSGVKFPDALSASALGLPVVIVSGNSLTNAQNSYLKTLKPKKATIIGGTASVSKAIETQLKSKYSGLKRIGGATRYETSTMVAQQYVSQPRTLVLAYGLKFPDGLSGGPLAYKYSSPLVLVTGNDVESARAYSKKVKAKSAVTLGGTSYVTDKAVRYILSTGITVTVSGGKAVLKWDTVAGAARYDIYDVTSAKTKKGTTKDKTYSIAVSAGTKYNFEVIPYDAKGKAITDTNPMFVMTGTAPAAVSGFKTVSDLPGGVKISWTSVKCNYYQVFRKTTGAFTQIGSTTSNSYTDKTAGANVKYGYYAIGVAIDDTGKIRYGSHTGSVQLTTKVLKPVITSTTAGTNKVTLTWKAVSGATKYEVGVLKNGKWYTNTTTATSYTFNKLDRSTQYSFTVCSCVGSSYKSEKTTVTEATDSTIKSKAAFKIYSSQSTSSSVLYSGYSGVVLTRKGYSSGNWYRVYVPGTNNTKYGYVQVRQFGKYVNLNFSPIDQLGWEGGKPLPTGCETTALATLLNRHLGFKNCTKNLLADKYLTIVGYRVGDPNYASWGSPYDSNAYGIMAPGLAETANRFLKANGVRDQYQIDVHTDNDPYMSWYKLDTGDIKHTKGLDLAGIKKELEKGHALCIWWITRGADPSSYTTFNIQRGQRYSHDGTGTYQFTWIGTQHGSVISGYDETTNQFIIADVGWGYTVYHSIDHFMKIYTTKGRQSIVIYKK